jgi:hypothetical protein
MGPHGAPLGMTTQALALVAGARIVLICATDLPILLILEIWTIEESASYLASTRI